MWDILGQIFFVLILILSLLWTFNLARYVTTGRPVSNILITISSWWWMLIILVSLRVVEITHLTWAAPTIFFGCVAISASGPAFLKQTIHLPGRALFNIIQLVLPRSLKLDSDTLNHLDVLRQVKEIVVDSSSRTYAYTKVESLNDNPNIPLRISLFRLFSFDIGLTSVKDTDFHRTLMDTTLEDISIEFQRDLDTVRKEYSTYSSGFYSLLSQLNSDPDRTLDVGHYLAELIYKGHVVSRHWIKMIDEGRLDAQDLDTGVIATMDGQQLMAEHINIRKLCQKWSEIRGVTTPTAKQASS